jgi:hypothetical protein
MYSVSVGASNAAGLSILADAAIVDAARPPIVVTPDVAPVVLLTGDSTHIVLVSGSGSNAINTSNARVPMSELFIGDSRLYYWISANPQSNSALSGGALTLTGAFRGISYEVDVSASNDGGLQAVAALTIDERGPGAPVCVEGILRAELGYPGETARMPIAFADPQGSPLSYWISSDPYSNASVIGRFASVVGECRGRAYGVTVACSNAYGIAASQVQTLDIVELPQPASFRTVASTVSAVGALRLSSDPPTIACSNLVISGALSYDPATYAVFNAAAFQRETYAVAQTPGVAQTALPMPSRGGSTFMVQTRISNLATMVGTLVIGGHTSNARMCGYAPIVGDGSPYAGAVTWDPTSSSLVYASSAFGGIDGEACPISVDYLPLM